MHVRGQCACGGVTFEVNGEPLAQLYCHCRSCQMAHSAPVVAAALFRASSVAYTGEVRRITVSARDDAAQRLVCAACGARVLVEPVPQVRTIFVVLCETRDWFAPQMHVQWRDHIVEVYDDLPKYIDYPRELGGTGDRARDPLVACVLAVEDCVRDGDVDRGVALTAARTAGASLRKSWDASCSASALLSVGELATPVARIVEAALACARIAHDVAPAGDPDVLRALELLEAWIAGRATDDDRRAISDVLCSRYNGRPLGEVPQSAWAAYCASCVGLSPSATAWFHAHAAAGCAESALRAAGRPAPSAIVAHEVRRCLSCPSVERLAVAVVDESFTLP